MKHRPVKVVQVKRSVAAAILAFQFGCLAALLGGYIDVRQIQDFNNQRDYDICIGVNLQLHRTVERLMENSSPDRRAEILQVVDQGALDCEVYKITK